MRVPLGWLAEWIDLPSSLDALVDRTQRHVTGSVRLKLYKGNIIIAGRTSPCSLYNEALASFGESDYDHADAAGFIQLFSLPTRAEALQGAPRQAAAPAVAQPVADPVIETLLAHAGNVRNGA